MSNFVNFLKNEHIIKLGVSFMIGYTTQDFFKSIVEHFVNKDKLKEYDPVYVNFITLLFVIIISYFLIRLSND